MSENTFKNARFIKDQRLRDTYSIGYSKAFYNRPGYKKKYLQTLLLAYPLVKIQTAVKTTTQFQLQSTDSQRWLGIYPAIRLSMLQSWLKEYKTVSFLFSALLIEQFPTEELSLRVNSSQRYTFTYTPVSVSVLLSIRKLTDKRNDKIKRQNNIFEATVISIKMTGPLNYPLQSSYIIVINTKCYNGPPSQSPIATN